MTVEDIAKRYEFSRPELRLVGYEEVGLPFYRVKIRAFTLEHKPIPAIEEFVLKTLHAGLVIPSDIAGFLGLPSKVVEGALSNLVRSEDVELGAAADGRRHMWRLTSKGQTTLQEAEQITPQQGTFEIDYDGLLRKVVNYKKDATYAPRELKDVGLVEIPAHPVRPPEMTDFAHEDVAREIAADTGRFKRQLVSIVAIEKRFRFFRPGVALVYRSESDGRVEVAFAVNGRVSPDHETAFAKANGPSRLGMDSQSQAAVSEALQKGIGPAAAKEVAAQLPPPAINRELRKAVADAESELLSARDALNAAVPKQQQQVRALLTESESKLARAREAIDALSATYLQVFDHPPRLEEALAEARERLLIVCPWIGACVVDDQFLRKLAKLATRGAQIYIGYGIGDDDRRPRSPRDIEAEKKLIHAGKTIQNLHVKRLGDTHAKVLAYDRTWAILTSFNWLSFKGAREKGYRDEQGVLLRIPSMIDRKFNELMPRFDLDRNK